MDKRKNQVTQPIEPAEVTIYPDGCTVPKGYVLPDSFVVRETKWGIPAGIVLMLLVLPGMVVSLLWPDAESPLVLLFALALIPFSLYVLLSSWNRCIELDGEQLRYKNLFGQVCAFNVQEIGAVKISANSYRFYDRDGKKLAVVEGTFSNLRNAVGNVDGG